MHFSLFAALAGVVVASQQVEVRAPDVSELIKSTGGKNATLVSAEGLHEIILSRMDSQYVVHSDDLHDYLSKNHGANHTIYVNDTGSFIHMGSVEPKLDKRQYGK